MKLFRLTFYLIPPLANTVTSLFLPDIFHLSPGSHGSEWIPGRLAVDGTDVDFGGVHPDSQSSVAKRQRQDNPNVNLHTFCLRRCACCRDMYFINASSPKPHPIYHIRTNWILRYPGQIKEALRNEGFEIVEKKSQLRKNITGCGWFRLHSYWGIGVHRGYVDVNGTQSQPHGDPDIVTRIQNVLQAHYPYFEIVILVETLLFPVLLFATLYVLIDVELAEEERQSKEGPKEPPKEVVPHKHSVKISQHQSPTSPPSAAGGRPTSVSLLLGLPVELQHEVISQLDFHSSRKLRATCRFYQSLITEPLLAKKRASHVEQLNRLDDDRIGTDPEESDLAVCFTCLRDRPKKVFEDRGVSTRPSRRRRSCIPCKVKTGKWKTFGARVTAGGQELWVCAHCQKIASVGKRWYAPQRWLCKICYYATDLTEASWFLFRLLQFFLAIILFGVACSGTLPSHMWLWIVTVSLVFLTLGFIFCSIIMSGGHSEGVGHPDGLCRPNLKLEVFVTLCWLGMAAVMVYEGIRSRHTKKRYDAKAFVVICFASIEVMLSVFTLCLFSSRLIRYLSERHVRKCFARASDIYIHITDD